MHILKRGMAARTYDKDLVSTGTICSDKAQRFAFSRGGKCLPLGPPRGAYVNIGYLRRCRYTMR